MYLMRGLWEHIWIESLVNLNVQILGNLVTGMTEIILEILVENPPTESPIQDFRNKENRAMISRANPFKIVL